MKDFDDGWGAERGVGRSGVGRTGGLGGERGRGQEANAE
jgi:hypothetical protein